MNRLDGTYNSYSDSLLGSVGTLLGLTKDKALPFTDPVKFLSEIFQSYDQITDTIHTLGWVTPDVAMAVERAGFDLNEIIPQDPFDNLHELYQNKKSENIKILYLSNPNRLTGSSMNINQLFSIVESLSEGLVIVDEFYFDYHGITAIPLLDLFKNLIITRSLTNKTGLTQTDLSLALGDEHLLNRYRDLNSPVAEAMINRNLSIDYNDRDGLNQKLKDIHSEALKIARELSNLKIQVRITPTDRLLIKVKSPKDVGNFLIRNGISIDNLHGYEMLDNILSFRIKDAQYNELLVDCFKKMPEENYMLKESVSFKQTLTRPAENESNFDNFRLYKKQVTRDKIESEV